jgi:hypothetical protein
MEKSEFAFCVIVYLLIFGLLQKFGSAPTSVNLVSALVLGIVFVLVANR